MKSSTTLKQSKISELTLTAVITAMVFIAGNIIKIPTFGGFVHLGDCMVLLAGVVLGKRKGAIASALGMALVDIYSGYIIWAPFTFVIKGIMAYLVGAILEKAKEKNIKSYLISFITAGIFMVVGYFIAGAIISIFFTREVNGIVAAMAYSAKDIIGNIMQVGTGIVIALPLSKVLLTAKNKIFNN